MAMARVRIKCRPTLVGRSLVSFFVGWQLCPYSGLRLAGYLGRPSCVPSWPA
jgi:hypothetical protein